ncbi:MAG TPA: hypothetical protein VK525_19435 [Candidatus Saccharimonadales bacterium]|nr:hypothetical protein [Candidatus Saccharimonadales bacterium]
MKKSRYLPLLLGITALGIFAPALRAQLIVDSRIPPLLAVGATSPAAKSPDLVFVYKRPSAKLKFRSYLFDTFGPYPIAGAAGVAGVNQAAGTPPEWGQGAEAYGHRFGSNFAIAGITTTTRYALAAALHEDTVYYRCECSGVFRRLRHALISTVTARHGEDGNRRISFPAIIAPYAGTTAAVYGWYPARYGPKDALRMGNYNLLAFAGENIALEFIYGGPHTLFSRFHRPAFSGTDATSSSKP